MKHEFVHLHLHTSYSLLDGYASIDNILDKAVEDKMKAVAITDHGVMFGVVDFYTKAMQRGIKPVLGCEMYVSPRNMNQKENIDRNPYHLVLLAETQEGYSNLLYLVSKSYIDGFFDDKPRIDEELLYEHHRGLIALSSCLEGKVQQNLLYGNYKKAFEAALKYNDIFGKNNFFLEMQYHGIAEEKKVNTLLKKLSKETSIDLVVTNNVHYTDKEDSKTHEIILCIKEGCQIDEIDRMEFKTDEFYFKTQSEMYELFSDDFDALNNTCKIAERCNVTFDFNTHHLPDFTPPNNYSTKKYFLKLCEDGLNKKYPNYDEKVKKRFDYEIKIIEEMGYIEYFLIVRDFVDYAKTHDIPVGPGRGSAAGSIISYCLNITDVDPLKFNLLFERFLNPERISMPDIDIDFCDEKRDLVIEYVKKKYHEDHVAQIITFGTFGARLAIKDVARVFGYTAAESDKLAKTIPEDDRKSSIRTILNKNDKLKKIYSENESVKKIIDFSSKIEGLPRHTSTHAAGIVICKEPVYTYVPLYMRDNTISTQFVMTELEKFGLLKMDFLGLKTLSVIQKTLNTVKNNKEKEIDFKNIDFNNKKVYELISSGKTLGVFQLESYSMRNFMKELMPDNFDDMVAGISLHRPGPMESIPSYIKNKNTPDKIKYDDESLISILEPTRGILIYQEQVMQIVRKLAGYSYGRADLVRKAMSKKNKSIMEKEREYFIYGSDKVNPKIPGCIKNGISETTANKIYDKMIDFGDYGYNKSHAVSYGVLAYRTAYLKTFYTAEFMSSLMSSVINNPDKISEYVKDSIDMKIEILKPDINKSLPFFTVEGQNIRYALSAVKNVGEIAAKIIHGEIEKKGEYKDFYDFADRINNVSKKSIESLIKCGAFDTLHTNRASLLSSYEIIIDNAYKQNKNKIKGQLSFYKITNDNLNTPMLKVSDFNLKQKLKLEKELLGLYLSGHPLEEFKNDLKDITDCDISDIKNGNYQVFKGKKIRIAGILSSYKIITSKSNKNMAFALVEDKYSSLEIILFPTIFQKYMDILTNDNCGQAIFIYGETTVNEEGEVKIKVSKICPLKNMIGKKIYIKIENIKKYDKISKIKNIIKKYPGKNKIIFFDSENSKPYVFDKWSSMQLNFESKRDLEQIYGADNVRIK